MEIYQSQSVLNINKLEKKYSEFVNNACDFYFELDNLGRGTYVSPSMKEYFGVSPEDIFGKNFFDFMSAEQRKEAKEVFEHFCAKQQPYRRSNTFGARENGRIIYYDVYFTPKFNDVGKFIGYRVLGWIKNKS